MRRKMSMCLIVILSVCAAASAVDVTAIWNPAGNTDPNTRSFWTTAANWSVNGQPSTVAPMAPSAERDWKAVFSVTNAIECILDTSATVGQLSMGDNGGVPGNLLRLTNGAALICGLRYDGTTNWSAVGYNRPATLVMEPGTSIDARSHLFIGRDGGDTTVPGPSTLIVDGATVTCGGNFALGNVDANKSDGGGYVTVKNGSQLNLAQLTVIKTAIGGSRLDIEEGTVRVNGNISSAVTSMIADGRVTGYYNAAFDKKRNPDVVYLAAPVNKTVITAVHPMEPAPLQGSFLPLGDVTLAWNNWDPNHPGAQILVDVYIGTEPNIASSSMTKVLTAANVTGQARSSVIVNLATASKYYWRVDTNNGALHQGDWFSFTATTDTPPVVDAGPSFVTWIGAPTQLDATITDEGVHTPTLAWTSLPAAGIALSNPAAEDPVVTASAVGTYTLTLTADDQNNAAVSDTITINVYTDACQAARTGMVTLYAADMVVDCKINLADLAVISGDWLVDYNLAVPAARY